MNEVRFWNLRSQNRENDELLFSFQQKNIYCQSLILNFYYRITDKH